MVACAIITINQVINLASLTRSTPTLQALIKIVCHGIRLQPLLPSLLRDVPI